jgi:hypothetical protein
VDDAPSLHRRAVCSKLARSNVAPLPASLVMDPYELFSASLVMDPYELCNKSLTKGSGAAQQPLHTIQKQLPQNTSIT